VHALALTTSLRSWGSRWLRLALLDRRGVAALEFGLIVPLLIGLYVGAVEIGNLLSIDRRLSEVTSTAADLTAQVQTVSTADLADITTAAESIITKSYLTSMTPPKIVLSSVVADANNTPKVAWSYAVNGATPRTTNSVVTLPTGLTQASSSVIMAEVTYAYAPLLTLWGFGSPAPFTISKTFYERPRRSLTVTETN